ncbi:hypothetical protein ABQ013_22445, partial [Xanthomonas citri pv. malvacearum]|uniref:hypothetical protein n=1 Tax=Xanthomonas citri TaxID=346 RepID=UPI0032E892AF
DRILSAAQPVLQVLARPRGNGRRIRSPAFCILYDRHYSPDFGRINGPVDHDMRVDQEGRGYALPPARCEPMPNDPAGVSTTVSIGVRPHPAAGGH